MFADEKTARRTDATLAKCAHDVLGAVELLRPNKRRLSVPLLVVQLVQLGHAAGKYKENLEE